MHAIDQRGVQLQRHNRCKIGGEQVGQWEGVWVCTRLTSVASNCGGSGSTGQLSHHATCASAG